jgi:ubiquinone/menaquinone biosynthesis C-methylase UbiE
MLRHLFGYEKERIGNTSFRVMSALLRIRDLFAPVETKVRSWGIKQGDTVVDFGCGPGSYIPIVSLLVGSAGRVYAMDMFHMVKDTKSLLHELWRITKPSGLLLIESGHQLERLAFQNLNESGLWAVERETGSAFRCRPRRK